MKPTRVHNFGTFFITSATWERRHLFRAEPFAKLLINTILMYRSQSKFLLHEFVIMPDHIHLILTPTGIPLERAVQLIKGGFSFRASRELGSVAEIWQPGFSGHRIRDAEDYEREREYLLHNPARAQLCQRAEEYPYSSADSKFERDDVPQRLKPLGIPA